MKLARSKTSKNDNQKLIKDPKLRSKLQNLVRTGYVNHHFIVPLVYLVGSLQHPYQIHECRPQTHRLRDLARAAGGWIVSFAICYWSQGLF